MNSEYITGKKRIIVYAIFILLGVFLSALVFLMVQAFYQAEAEKVFQQRVAESEKYYKKEAEKRKIREENFLNLEIEAEGVYVKDLTDNQILFLKNENKKFGIASLTKIATADVALDNLGEKQVVLNRTNLGKIGEYGLIAGEKWNLEDLIIFMMSVSSNDAASALTNFIGPDLFIQKMNDLADRLSLGSTIFFSESGLDINPRVAGSYSSALDVAKLVEYFYKKHPQLSEKFSVANLKVCSDIICHEALNTNKLILPKKVEHIEKRFGDDGEEIEEVISEESSFPYKVYFSKTGYTNVSGGSLAMVVEIDGHRILVVLLSSGEESRFSDMEKILTAIKNYLVEWKKIEG